MTIFLRGQPKNKIFSQGSYFVLLAPGASNASYATDSVILVKAKWIGILNVSHFKLTPPLIYNILVELITGGVHILRGSAL